MKKSFLLLSLATLGLSMVQAAQYTITFTTPERTTERYTDCTVIYKSSSTTKFRGTDKSGKTITKEIPSSSIIMMREVIKEEAQEDTPAQETQEPAQATETPAVQATETAPAAESKEAEQAPIADGNITQREGEDKAKDATLRLRSRLTEMETLMSKISKPSRALQSQVDQVKRRVTSQLAEMDKQALNVAKLQEDFNQAGAADFTFDKVSADQRDQYLRDGQAAYRAMRTDMKEKKGRRKVAGLDKFEIMRDRYQGIPEYKEAYEWYVKTLYALQKKWTNMLNKEEAARKRLATDKRTLRTKQDNEEYNEIAQKLKEDGDDIGKVWFVPPSKNQKMLAISVNKVKDAIRRNEDHPLDKEVGTVPALLEQFWADMDKVRMAIVTGNLEGADQMLRSNAAYPTINRLKNHLLPSEYREPLKEQYKETQKTIQSRMRGHTNLKRSLERATDNLTRITTSADAQIDSAMTAVQKELDADSGENTMEIEVPAENPQPTETPATEQSAPQAN